MAFLWLASSVSAEDIAGKPISSPLLELADRVTAIDHQMLDAHDGHYAGVVENPYRALLLRVHLIRAARQSIDLQTFIWGGDECSNLIAYELVQAAKRGVKVRVLIDSLVSTKDAKAIAFDQTTYANIGIKIYWPPAVQIKPGTPHRPLNIGLPMVANERMHNKLLIVDGRIGVTGGRNVANEDYGLSSSYNADDRDVIVVGPQVRAMIRSFDEYWKFKHVYFNYQLKTVAKLLEKDATRPELTRDKALLDTMFIDVDRDASDPTAIQRLFTAKMTPVGGLVFVADAPGKKTDFAFANASTRSRMTNAFLKSLGDTHDELLMQSPYVILNLRMRNLFRQQIRKAPGLHVRISTNSISATDQILTYAANYRLRSKVVLGLKFEVYELKSNPAILPEQLPRFEELKQRAMDEGKSREPYLSIHSKTYIFDAQVVYIGAFNLDPRSFYVNDECGVFIDDADFAKSVRETVLREMSAANSWVIARSDHRITPGNSLIESTSSALPIDPWPFRSTSSYELKPGAEEVEPTHPDFYKNYKDVGSFPGSKLIGRLRIKALIYKTFGKTATPLL